MTIRVQLEQALTAPESLRGTLPDDVVDATVFALRQQLAEMEPATPDEQRKQVTVLFADLAALTLNFMDKFDALNKTAWALTEQGLSFVATGNLHR